MNVLPVEDRRRERAARRPDDRAARRAADARPAPRLELGIRPEYRAARPRGHAGHDHQGRGYRPPQGRARHARGPARSPPIVGEDDEHPGRRRRSTFDPAGINLYADSWRVEMGSLSHGKDLEQQGLVHGAAGAGAGGLLGGHPADDRGQLFGAGHVRQQRVLLGRHRLVRARCCTPTASGMRWAATCLLRHHPRHRDPARHLHRAQHAARRAGACRSASC